MTRSGLMASAAALVLALVPATALAISPLPGGTGEELEPGKYVDNSLGMMFTFDVDEGWRQGFPPNALWGIDLTTVDHQTFADGWGAQENLALLAFVPFSGDVTSEGYCVPAGGDSDSFEADLSSIETSPQALADHIAADPLLEVTEPTEVEVAGFEGLQFGAVASVGDECATPETYLWESWTLLDGFVGTYMVLDIDGQSVIVALETSPDVDHEAFVARSMPVIESLKVVPM